MITNTITIPPSFPPTKWAPSPSPTTSDTAAPPQQPKQTIVFTPPLIAMVVVIAAAFLLITYSRLITRYLHLTRRRITRWRNRNRQFLPSTSGDDSFYDSPFATTTDGYHPYSPFGLDDSFIKNIPLTIYDASIDSVFECAVCLVDFESGNCMRTLPVCSHAFHVECIDTWLKSHANCPICRAHVVVKQESPFVPLMCSRIRPSFDEYDVVLEQEVNTVLSEMVRTNGDEIQVQQELSSMRELKRSYSFDFERMELPTTSASPWRYRRSSFWSKRNSPFGMLSKPRVFSFRGMKSPFFRRRGFFPMSEGGGGSRRRRSVTAAGFSSSRMRCGDPEALLSPERFNGR